MLSDNLPAGIFELYITGSIEKADINARSIYLHYSFCLGDNWCVCAGADEGITQMSFIQSYSQEFVFNTPLEICLRSVNPYGWPKLVICAFGSNRIGRGESVQGYGVCTIPVQNGTHEVIVPLVIPRKSIDKSKESPFTRFLHCCLPRYIKQSNAEFRDVRVLIDQIEDRSCICVSSCGSVTCRFNIVSKGLQGQESGYCLK
ncbi:hypothetical protein GJ496_010218 [Pomphorhynchus laevis]|nr:hypothetical protein GJ496_010218 [Pomphorhynchus laevis]